MILKFSDISTSLSTRNLGLRVRERILSELRQNEAIVFDLSDVEMITNSFADECFAKLLFDFELNELRKLTSFKDASPLVSKIIASSFKERISKQALA